MIPEEGKRYYLRYGGVSGTLAESGCADRPWTDGVFTWMADGKRWHDVEVAADLIREYIDPQPLEWKRGIPTEEECRECWIIYGGRGDVPNDEGQIYQPKYSRSIWRSEDWYLALRIKPVEQPKPKTVTQRQYISDAREELWTDRTPASVDKYWKETGLAREVPA